MADDDRHAPMPQPGCNTCACGRVATDSTYHIHDEMPEIPDEAFLVTRSSAELVALINRLRRVAQYQSMPASLPDKSIYLEDANGTVYLAEPAGAYGAIPLYRLTECPPEVQQHA